MNIGSWKAGSPTSNSLLLKAQSRELFVGLQQSYSTTESTITYNHCIVRNKSCMRQLRGQTLCFSAWNCFFATAATKGWAWWNHNAELVEHAAALRKPKLLAGSGCLEFPQGIVGKDSLNKHVALISFRQCITFCEHWQLKGWPACPTHCC